MVCPGYTLAGMYLAVGLPAPSLVNVFEPTDVANAVLRAIKQKQQEVILDGALSRLLYATTQLSPQFGDAFFRWIGLTKLNQTCAENQKRSGNLVQN